MPYILPLPRENPAFQVVSGNSNNGAISLELDSVTATAYDRKELKITCVNEKGKAIALNYDATADTFTSKLTFDEGTVCYVGVSTTNQKKYDTEYQITAGIIV